MNNTETTPFSSLYDFFLAKITDDLYLELTEIQTFYLLQDLVGAAVLKFEFPKVSLEYEEMYEGDSVIYQGVESDDTPVVAYVCEGGYFLNKLSKEELNIIATYMVVEWLSQQLASVEVTRTKYYGSEFKSTSQANHMAKLSATKDKYEKEGFHLQRLYSRRRLDENGIYQSTLDTLMSPTRGVPYGK